MSRWNDRQHRPVSQGSRFETPNELLDESRDRLESVVVIGWDNDGDFFWRTTANSADVNWMLDLLKIELLTPTVGVELDE